MPGIAVLLAPQVDIQKEGENGDHTNPSSGKNRKGKKRARGYEGDEVFKINREILCPTDEDGKVVLAIVNG